MTIRVTKIGPVWYVSRDGIGSVLGPFQTQKEAHDLAFRLAGRDGRVVFGSGQ